MNKSAKDRHQRGWTEEEIEAEARAIAAASLRPPARLTTPESGLRSYTVSEVEGGSRLDRFLADRFPSQSRSSLARAIDQGAARIDGVVARGSVKLREGSTVRFVVPQPPREGPLPEEIPLEFLHRDEALAVVDKPAGMVVHPAAGNWHGTLVNAVLHHCPDLEGVGGARRPGIVHRLDKDTSGVILVAKNDAAQRALQAQFAARTVVPFEQQRRRLPALSAARRAR
jgi:23S rRNA pseudouridine1911/1915/1917 synthase